MSLPHNTEYNEAIQNPFSKIRSCGRGSRRPTPSASPGRGPATLPMSNASIAPPPATSVAQMWIRLSQELRRGSPTRGVLPVLTPPRSPLFNLRTI